METISNLVTAPLNILGQVVGASSAPSSSGAAAAAASPFDQDSLQRLVYNIFQGDARLQQATLEEHYAEDVTFTDGTITLTSRDDLLKLLTGLTTLADIKPDIIDISVGPTEALVLVNLRLAWRLLPWTFLRRLVVPLTINLSYTTSLLGRGIITEQVHHMSYAGLVWYGQNPLSDWFMERVWAPRSGLALSLAQVAADGLSGSWDHTLGMFLSQRSQGANLADAAMATIKSTTALFTSGPTAAAATTATTPPTPTTQAHGSAASGSSPHSSSFVSSERPIATATDMALGQAQAAAAGALAAETALAQAGTPLGAAGGKVTAVVTPAPAGDTAHPAMTPLSEVPVASVTGTQ